VKKKMKKEKAPKNIFIKKKLLRDCDVKKKSPVNILLTKPPFLVGRSTRSPGMEGSLSKDPAPGAVLAEAEEAAGAWDPCTCE
jgi:hypothetical protein